MFRAFAPEETSTRMLEDARNMGMAAMDIARGTTVPALDLRALLDGMRDPAYVVDLDGCILAVAAAGWDAFAAHVGAPAPPADELPGQNLFDFIAGDDVRAAYRELHRELAESNRPAVAFRHRCDSPDHRREMRTSVTPLRIEGEVRAFFYHTITLREIRRLPMALVENLAKPHPELPPVLYCSFCNRVRSPAGDESARWRSVESYYQAGGSTDVNVTHGVCADCIVSVVQPLLR